MRQRISNRECDHRADDLEGQQQVAQLLLVNRPGEENEEVDEGEIVAAHDAVLAFLPFDQSQGLKDEKQQLSNSSEFFFSERRLAVVQQAGFRVEFRQPMSRAGNEVEKLRHRINKIEHLRDEKQQNRLAEVAENADDRESHARKVVERVADEDLRRISEKNGKKR